MGLVLIFLAGLVGIPVGIGLGSVVVIVAAVGAMVLSAVLFFVIAGREHRRDQAALAAEGDYLEHHGFEPSALFDTAAAIEAPLPLFAKGRKDPIGSDRSHGIGGARVGEVGGRRIAIADYSIITRTYNQSTGSTNTSTEKFAVALAEVPAELPPFSLEREGILSRTVDRVGLKDLELGHAHFDRAFQVKAEDPELVRELLDPELLERLVAMPDTVELAGGGRFIAAWRPGTIESGPRKPIVEAVATAAARLPSRILQSGPPASTAPGDEPW